MTTCDWFLKWLHCVYLYISSEREGIRCNSCVYKFCVAIMGPMPSKGGPMLCQGGPIAPPEFKNFLFGRMGKAQPTPPLNIRIAPTNHNPKSILTLDFRLSLFGTGAGLPLPHSVSPFAFHDPLSPLCSDRQWVTAAPAWGPPLLHSRLTSMLLPFPPLAFRFSRTAAVAATQCLFFYNIFSATSLIFIVISAIATYEERFMQFSIASGL